MKDTKRRLEWFSFYDHTGLEAHLGEMAARGWLLEKIGNFTWHYRRTEPKQLTFCVSYFPKASQFDPGPSQEQETFYDFCAHTGWTLAAASAQMQVFYNERPNPVPIDTDPVLEVESIHQSAKKGFLLPQFLLLSVGVLNLGQFLWRLLDDPIATLSSTLALFSLVCWPVLILLEGVDLTTYFRWRHRALKAAEQGEFLATKSHPMLQKLALAVVLAGLAWCLSYLQGGMATLVAVSMAGTFGSVLAAVQIRELLKRNKVPANANRAATLGACVALPLVTVVLVTALVVSSGGGRQADPGQLPLTISELMDGPGGGTHSQSMMDNRSPLLAVMGVHQSFEPYGAGWTGYVWMEYTVIQVKASALYDTCKNQLLHEYDSYDGHYFPVDTAPWNAQEAYQFGYEVPDGKYLLCYPGRIVEIVFDWEPTAEQIAIAAEKLGGP